MKKQVPQISNLLSSSRGMAWREIVLVVSILVVLVVLIGYIFHYKNSADQNDEALQDEVFQSEIQRGGNLLLSGNSAEAATHFQNMVEQAETPVQEGQAKLNVGVAKLAVDREEGITLLKEVSLNDAFDPLTRAKAVNYVLNEYTATKDAELAREHIFTGPTWEDFLIDSASLDSAVLEGFEFSRAIHPTPEANTRIAAETAFLLWKDGVTQEEKDEYATEVLSLISDADNAIAALRAANRVRYGDTHYTEIALAYHRKGMALDVLYFHGYVDDPELVKDAFQDALNVLMEHESGTGTELFARYHYADFLLRLADEGHEASISKILAPMTQMEPTHTTASFFREWLGRDVTNQPGKEKQLAQPANIIRLAAISPEFKEALLGIGINEEVFQ